MNLNSKVFDTHRDRLKGYKDFRTDLQRQQFDSHGTHVTSLFLRMAPEADVYVAQAFDSWESLTKVSVKVQLKVVQANLWRLTIAGDLVCLERLESRYHLHIGRRSHQT